MSQISVTEDKIPLLRGVNGKFTADVNVALPTAPLPVSSNAIAKVSFSADGKAAIGNDVSLGLSAQTSLTLAALYKEETGAAPDLAKEFGLDAALTPANLMLALDVGGKADVSLAGSYKYSVLSATASLEAGADTRLVNTRVYDDRQLPSGKLLENFLGGLSTPGSVRIPPPPGHVSFLEFGGYLNFGASVAAGYRIKGTHDFQNVGALKLSEHYKLSVTGKLSLSAKLAGRFSVEVRNAVDLHPGDQGWARVTVKRQRSKALQIAADLSVGANTETRGLPATGKEFLGALLGLRAKNWINQVDSILGQAASIHTAQDLKTKLDSLANSYISRFANKAVDDLIPNEVQDLLGKVQNAVDSYNKVGDSAVALVDRYFDKTDSALRPALAHIESLASWDQFKGNVDPVIWNVVQQLTGGNILDLILEKTTGLKKLQDAAANVTDLIEDAAHTNIRNFIALAQKEFHLDTLVGEISKFATLDELKAQASKAAQGLAERIIGKAVDQIGKDDFKNLTAFVQKIQHAEQGFFESFDKILKEAASQSFRADIGLAYDRSDEHSALIDVDIRLVNSDGTANTTGIGLLSSAGLGDFTKILSGFTPDVVLLREGSLTHKMSSSTGVKINIAGWHKNFQYQSVYKVAVESEQRLRVSPTGMLNVFTTVDMSASHDTTRKTNKHEQEMHSNFTLRFLAESKSPTLNEEDHAYLLEVVSGLSAAYTNKLVDTDTTPAKLERILAFAATLGLDSKGATLQALKPFLQLNNGSYGAIEADYRVRFSERGLSSLFRDPTPLDKDTIRTLLRRIVVSSYNGHAALAPVAWLYASDRVREIYEEAGPNFTDSSFRPLEDAIRNHELQSTPHLFGLEPFYSVSQSSRRLTDTLFRVEDSILDGFQHLHEAVRQGNVSLKELENASKKFGEALNSFDSLTALSPGNSSPVFAVFDGLIQLAAPMVQSRDSALSLKLGTGEKAKAMLFQLASMSASAVMAA